MLAVGALFQGPCRDEATRAARRLRVEADKALPLDANDAQARFDSAEFAVFDEHARRRRPSARHLPIGTCLAPPMRTARAHRRARRPAGVSEEAVMARKITEDCISCDACEGECPHEAISQGEDIYVIDASKCDECKTLPEPGCVSVCPVADTAIVMA
jgi:ferredoxin